ncbi:hypothetical protein EDD21DRAFT_441723, partial [Dissophora ornata]
MLSVVYSKARSSLSPQSALEIANVYLENAHKAKNAELDHAYCSDAEAALLRIKLSLRKDLVSSSRVEDRTLREGIAAIFFELSELFERLGDHSRAHISHRHVEKWGGYVKEQRQANHAVLPVADPSTALVTDPSATLIVGSSTALVVDANATKPPPPSTLPQPPLIQDSSGRATEPTVP